ncbi:hypothetical protein AVW11_04035 [Streptomyces amritsarensis]|uniref:Uncharacterized protein n=1 Tax=Streptomyces amritsarensis TaxID=681158 RepID=A0ABX3G8V3_9ACTN|nr:hypothetical protein [Streptomyces amritsarensis]OLZ72570.1 hypothetical protein AVW11_04035 [Streptomyces amritsarensis]
MPFDLGDTVRLRAECRNPGGTLTNAATVALTVTLPDGTTATPSVTNPPGSDGEYQVDYPTTQAGRHGARWVFGTPAAAYTDMFDVRAAVPPLILSLADGRRHLQIPAGDTSADEQLREWLESVTELVEGLCGPCVRRTVVEDHTIGRGGAAGVALRRTPVLSVTSAAVVQTGGESYAAVSLDVDSNGVLRRLDGGRLYGPLLRVTYVAGRTIVPANLSSAARIILQHLWRTQYGASRALSGLGGGEDFAVTEPIAGFGYAIPNRALQLMEPHRLPPGVA